MSRLREWLQKSMAASQKSMPASGINAVITKALSAAGLMKDNTVPRPSGTAAPNDARQPAHDLAADQQFFWATVASPAGTLEHKVFLPSAYATSSKPMPLIVMLHGCTQDPDDFAIGTRMNVFAEQHGFIVAYPMQPALANSSKCWNWFRPDDQQRDRGEPQKIAAMVKDLIARYRVDTQRVYVAGMSAGAAMAVIMSRTYPDLFAAAAAHSGLPYRSASNVVSALNVMKNPRADSVNGASGNAMSNVPLIVFHGDRDATVSHANGTNLVEQTLADWTRSQALSPGPTTHLSEGGRDCDRVLYQKPDGETAIEFWTIHGAGHQWTGGDPRGSHTDRAGPDASAHFVEFFLKRSRH